MNYHIVVSLPARRDFRNLKRYISLDSPPAAERFAELLRSKTKSKYSVNPSTSSLSSHEAP